MDLESEPWKLFTISLPENLAFPKYFFIGKYFRNFQEFSQNFIFFKKFS